MTARADKADRIGELVGSKYRIVRLLAEGGMGVVYEAQHAVVRRRFAIKFLRPDLAERRDILGRFQREAEAAGALESENVAAAVDFGIVPDGTPYIVMEYLVGESLGDLLRREGPLAVDRAADLASQAARGIEIAHRAGIVHRDLKPQNLFLCRRQDGTDLLKVIDFGVAKLQAIDEMNAATRTGALLGTVAYMSPEQARGDKIVDHRSDVYALGAILYEMLAGQKPHPAESHNATLHHIATHPAVPLASVRTGLPDGLVELVAGTLSSDPAARPPSADAFALALIPFAGRQIWPTPKLEDSGPTRVGADRREVTPPSVSARSVSGPSPSPRPVSAARGPRLVWVVGAAVGLLASVALVVVVASRRRSTSIATPASVSAPTASATATTGGAEPPQMRQARPAAPSVAASSGTEPSTPIVPASPVRVTAEPPTSTSTAAALDPRAASGGTDGHAPSRTARRRGNVMPPSPATAARPTVNAKAASITFDQDNPYK
ncbi:MAG TPA: protein kinase [Polyangia bacterium]|nr:protein kinase [Polyangia bacterium]